MASATSGAKAPPNLGRVVGLAFLLAALGMAGIDVAHRVGSDLAEEPHQVPVIAAALKEIANPDDIVISRKPHVPYFAGLKRIFPRAESVNKFREAAEESGARFLIHSDSEARMWPPLAAFRDPSLVSEYGFRLVYRHEDTHTLIYELEGAGRPSPRPPS